MGRRWLIVTLALIVVSSVLSVLTEYGDVFATIASVAGAVIGAWGGAKLGEWARRKVSEWFKKQLG